MLEKQNKIIIVDNTQDELDRLGKSFFNNGLGCRTFLYTTDYDEEPLKNIRLAFFDINLTTGKEILTDQDIKEIIQNHTSVLNDIAFALQQFIHEENGPYALIFWTKNVSLVEAIKEYIRDPQRGYSNISSPVYVGYLDKAEFTDENIQNLSDTIINLINSNQKIKFLFDFEENSRIAGENTLNRIYNILPKTDLWGESDQMFEDLDKVLSKIAASTLGFEHAKENPQKAIYEGLLPLINHEFLKRESDVNWNDIVNKLITAPSYNSLVSPNSNIQHQVNALYHIEEFNGYTKETRGCVIEIDKKSEELLSTFNIENVETWISKLLVIKEGNEAQKARKEEILNEAKLVAVEISAACDYSNKKSRINKYILGVLTTNLNDSDLNLKSRPEYCYHLGGCCFYYDDKNYHIWLNLNYVFGAMPNDTRLGNPLFVLKKEIMDMLGNKYASHISRIGITSF